MGRGRKKKNQPASRDGPIDWAKAVLDVPTEDFLEGNELKGGGDLSQGLDSFIWAMERKKFLAWEAVIRDEQGLRLSAVHQEQLEDLLDFGGGGDRILYIDDGARLREPWYETARKIARRLVRQQVVTAGIEYQVMTEGWWNLVDCFAKHATELSLPRGVKTAIEVIPAEVRHRLFVEASCSRCFGGIGQKFPDGFITLSSREWGVKEFVDLLREHRDSVEHLALTLETLGEILVMPPQDQLGLASAQEMLASRL